jgi:hypothetical protein
MKRFLVVTVVFAAVMVAIASMASATVVNVASWRGGENDVSPGPTGSFGFADTTAVDGSGNGHNLTNSGVTIFYAYPGDYTSGLPAYPYPAAGQAATSSVDYAWAPGSGAFTSTTPVATGADNWGVQLWVKPGNATDKMVYLTNGDSTAGSDISLFQLNLGTGAEYYAEVGSYIYSIGAVDTANWHNLALVNDAGTVSFYLDGVAKSSTPNVHASITPGAFLGLGVNIDGTGGMAGGIDEARIFTFAPGAFQVSDLGFVPEPGTLTLLATGVFGLLAYAWRKRK